MQLTIQLTEPSNCITSTDIVAYLNDRLSAAESYAIEEHLLDCPLCATAVEGYFRTSNQDLLSNSTLDLELKNMVTTNAALQELPVTSAPLPSIKKMSNRFWLAAAVLLLALPFGYYFYENSPKPAQLSAEYGSLMPAPEAVVRGENAIATTDLQHAFLAYEQADYATSFSKFQAIATADPQNTEAAFYAGLSAIGKKDAKQAEFFLEKVHLSPENANSNDAIWYLAMLELDKNNTQRAKDFLHELAATPNDWQEKAKMMLAKLEN